MAYHANTHETFSRSEYIPTDNYITRLSQGSIFYRLASGDDDAGTYLFCGTIMNFPSCGTGWRLVMPFSHAILERSDVCTITYILGTHLSIKVTKMRHLVLLLPL
jgi:hypothetical protein